MTENAHIRIENTCRGYPLRLGTFSTFGRLETPVGFVVHTSAFTAHRSAIPGKLCFFFFFFFFFLLQFLGGIFFMIAPFSDHCLLVPVYFE